MRNPLRVAVGNALVARVAGDDSRERDRAIWGQAGERWFTPDDPIWRVHLDAAMFPGGVAALLLQSLHPRAMAGVAGHSGYQSDPWGRLARTATYIAATTYGTIPHAEAVIAQVRARHERVRGKDHRGRPYRASDPDLLAWIHAAEIRSFLATHQAYGRRPLTAEEADTYVRQTGPAARLLGVPEPPETVAQLEATVELFRDELEASPDALEAARFLFRKAPLPAVAVPGYWTILAGGVATLSPWAREMLRPALPPLPRPVARTLGALGTLGVRWGLDAVEGDRHTIPAVTA